MTVRHALSGEGGYTLTEGPRTDPLIIFPVAAVAIVVGRLGKRLTVAILGYGLLVLAGLLVRTGFR
jgi:hypothetical protein